MTPRQKERSLRWYRRLLQMLPFDFRWEHGREMEQDFRFRQKEEDRNGGRLIGMLKLWWETIADLAGTAPREHWDMLLQDTRYALRSMRKNPGFTVVAVLTLALGIGANTAIFSVVHAVAWGPLPFRDADRLVRVYLVPESGAARISPRPGVFLAVRESVTAFRSVAGQQFANLTLRTDAEPRRVAGMFVSEGWLGTLGVDPIAGRPFTPAEERLGLDSGVVLISHRLWDQEFGRSADAIGKGVTIDARAFTVVGVLPPGFRYPYDNDVWLPVDFATGAPSSWGMNIQARLKDGVTLEQARAELVLVTPGIVSEFAEVSTDETLVPFSTRELLLGDNGNLVLALLAAVGFMLAIVCVNVGNLLLARAHGRRKEFAIRGALGARRSRQVRQLLTESLLLAGIGGVAGFALAAWSDQLLPALIPGRMANLVGSVPMDTTVLWFGLGTTLIVGLAFGMLPALSASRPDLRAVLAEGGRSGGRGESRRLLDALIVAEAALAMLLLTGAGLMVRNFEKLQRADIGYPTKDLVTFSVSLESERYSNPEVRIQFVRGVLDGIRALPWVERAGVTSNFPIDDGALLASFEIEGVPIDPGQANLSHYRLISPDFLDALEAPLLQGRFPDASDTSAAPPVSVISASIARKHFPKGDAIGKRMRNSRRGEDAPWVTVIGVVGDVKEFYNVGDAWYLPYGQDAAARAAAQVVFTVRGPSSTGTGRELREAVWAVDSNLAVFNLAPVGEQHGDSLSEQRMGALMGGVFSAFGLLLAALGLYGVMAYAVGTRTHEIGIRMAMGAYPRQILALIFWRGVGLALVGIFLGLVAATGLTRYLASLLTGIEATDPVAFAGAAFVLVIVSLGACWIPARRAMKVDPMVALRYE